MHTHRNTTIRDRHRKTIARDAPPCGICGGEIDYDLTHPHPRSYVVDHIIPIAKGGLDELANKQAAHRQPRLQPHQKRPTTPTPRTTTRTHLRHLAHLVNTQGEEPPTPPPATQVIGGISLPVAFSTPPSRVRSSLWCG